MARNNREVFGNFLADISQAFGNYWQFQHEEQRYQTRLASDEANLWANRAWDTYAPESDIDAQWESYKESYPKADESTIRRRLELGMRPTTQRMAGAEEFLKDRPFYAGDDADLWKRFGLPGEYDPSEIATGVPEHLKAPDLFGIGADASIPGSVGKDIPTEDYPMGYNLPEGDPRREFAGLRDRAEAERIATSNEAARMQRQQSMAANLTPTIVNIDIGGQPVPHIIEPDANSPNGFTYRMLTTEEGMGMVAYQQPQAYEDVIRVLQGARTPDGEPLVDMATVSPYEGPGGATTTGGGPTLVDPDRTGGGASRTIPEAKDGDLELDDVVPPGPDGDLGSPGATVANVPEGVAVSGLDKLVNSVGEGLGYIPDKAVELGRWLTGADSYWNHMAGGTQQGGPLTEMGPAENILPGTAPVVPEEMQRKHAYFIDKTIEIIEAQGLDHPQSAQRASNLFDYVYGDQQHVLTQEGKDKLSEFLNTLPATQGPGMLMDPIYDPKNQVSLSDAMKKFTTGLDQWGDFDTTYGDQLNRGFTSDQMKPGVTQVAHLGPQPERKPGLSGLPPSPSNMDIQSPAMPRKQFPGTEPQMTQRREPPSSTQVPNIQAPFDIRNQQGTPLSTQAPNIQGGLGGPPPPPSPLPSSGGMLSPLAPPAAPSPSAPPDIQGRLTPRQPFPANPPRMTQRPPSPPSPDIQTPMTPRQPLAQTPTDPRGRPQIGTGGPPDIQGGLTPRQPFPPSDPRMTQRPQSGFDLNQMPGTPESQQLPQVRGGIGAGRGLDTPANRRFFEEGNFDLPHGASQSPRTIYPDSPGARQLDDQVRAYATGPTNDFAQSTTEETPEMNRALWSMLRNWINTESKGAPDAHNEGSGARGLLQIIESAAFQELVDAEAIDPTKYPDWKTDPQQNMEIGMKYLHRLASFPGGNYGWSTAEDALSAYHAGPTLYSKYRDAVNTGGHDPNVDFTMTHSDGSTSTYGDESRKYAGKVLGGMPPEIREALDEYFSLVSQSAGRHRKSRGGR
jgi:hypothetical protein